jgi:hypothetical protein
MALYLVAYDLGKKSGKDYQDLWDQLDSLVSVKIQDSVYLISSSKTQRGLFDLLKRRIHEKDRLIVVEFKVRPSWRKGLPGTLDWLGRHVPR